MSLHGILAPFKILLRLTGACPAAQHFDIGKTIILRVCSGFQILWILAVFCLSSVVPVFDIKRVLSEDTCKIRPFLRTVSNIGREIFVRLSLFLVVCNMWDVFETECKKLDTILSKYFSRMDWTVVKFLTLPMMAGIGVYACFLFEYYSPADVVALGKDLIMLFPDLDEQNESVSWIFCMFDYFTYISLACVQLVIALICACLAVCFKRIRLRIPATDNRESSKDLNSVMWVLLEDHSMLCNAMERIGSTISVLLLLYTCCDMLWILEVISDVKSGHLTERIAFFWSYVIADWLHVALRTAALVYLSDQVTFDNLRKQYFSSTLHSGLDLTARKIDNQNIHTLQHGKTTRTG